MASIELLRLFLSIADHGKIAGAADALDLSPSFVSRRLMELERELGGRLFTRTTRSLKLTESGVQALAWARETCAEYDVLRAHIAGELGQPPREIRAAGPDLVVERILLPAMHEFLRRDPGARFHLSSLGEPGSFDETDYDLVIHTGEMPAGAWRAKKIGDYHRGLYASRTYVEREGEPRAPADLATHRCLSYTLTDSPDAWLFELKGELVSQPVRPTLETNNFAVFLDAIRHGHGIARLSRRRLIAAGLEQEVVRLLPEYNVVNTQAQAPGLWMLTAPRRMPRHVAEYAEIVATYVQGDWSGGSGTDGGLDTNPDRVSDVKGSF